MRILRLAQDKQSTSLHPTSATAKNNRKPTNIPINKPVGKPIDDALLADGLGAFVEVFVNYHSGKEGDKLTRWIMGLLQDPRFAEVAPLLEQLHKLPAEIYHKVVEIAKDEPKVAAAIGTIKLAVLQSGGRFAPSKQKIAQNDNADRSMTLKELCQQHPEWLDHTLVVATTGGHFDYIGAAGSVHEADEWTDMDAADAKLTGRKLLVFEAN